MSPLRRLAALLLAALAAACATTTRIEAAGDVHALLVAIRDNDRAGFDAHVDRPALEAEIQARIVSEAHAAPVGEGWKALGVLLSGPVSRAAGAALIRPDVFRAVADYYGYRPEMKIPSVLALSTVLRALPDGRVCATKGKGGACLVTFADEAGTWRLTSVDAALLDLRRR